MKITEQQRRRFWSYVDQRNPEECWPWLGTMRADGYGTFRIGSAKDGSRTNAIASRVMIVVTGRWFSPNENALHTCDNPCCVNPCHLYVGTQSDNLKDAYRRKRMVSPAKKGEHHGRAKITEKQARAIKASVATNRYLAKKYGISETSVSYIKSGTNWSHLA